MCCNHSYVIKYTALAGTSVVCKLFEITLKFNSAKLCTIHAYHKIYKKFTEVFLSRIVNA